MPFNNSRANYRQWERGIRKNAELGHLFRAMKCPCGVQDGFLSTTRTSITCPRCGGWGWVYDDVPIPILGVASSYQLRRDLVEAAAMEPGDLTYAPLPRTKIWISDFDLIRFPKFEDGEVFEGEYVIRTSGPDDLLRWIIKKVDLITTVAQDGTRTDYHPGIDFTSSGRTVTWLSGHGPAAGIVYSVRYRAIYDWVATNPPYARYARGTQLGQRVMLRKRPMVRTTGE